MTDVHTKQTVDTEKKKCKPDHKKHDGAGKEPHCKRQRVMVHCM